MMRMIAHTLVVHLIIAPEYQFPIWLPVKALLLLFQLLSETLIKAQVCLCLKPFQPMVQREFYLPQPDLQINPQA